MDTVAPAADGAPPAEDNAPPARRSRLGRLAALVGAVGAVAYVGLVDPGSGSGLFPPCPSRMLLGIDCPACGGLRGTHDLLHGDVVGALDHNLLLPLLLGLYAYAAVVAFAPLVGRAVRPLRPPRWALVAGAVVFAAFTVLRNLPVASARVPRLRHLLTPAPTSGSPAIGAVATSRRSAARRSLRTRPSPAPGPRRAGRPP